MTTSILLSAPAHTQSAPDCGTLHLSESDASLFFIPHKSQGIASLTIPLSQITGMMVSLPNSEHALLRVNLNLATDGIKEHVFVFDAKPSTKAIEQRDLFKDTLSQLISSQKASEGDDSNLRGLENQLLTDVRPSSDDTVNQLHFKITPLIIHQIFKEYPAVRKFYDEQVPALMSEKEFWTVYFKTVYFHRLNLNPNQNSNMGKDEIEEGLEDGVEAPFVKLLESEDARDREEIRVKSSNSSLSDPMVNLMVNGGADDDDEGDKNHDHDHEQATKLARTYHRHARAVLDTSNATPASGSGSVIEDLDRPVDDGSRSTVPLKIQDPRHFSVSTTSVLAMDDGSGSGRGEQLRSSSSSEPSFSKSDVAAIPIEYLRSISSFNTAAAELLRYLYATCPPKTKVQEEKVKNIVSALRNLLDKIQVSVDTHSSSIWDRNASEAATARNDRISQAIVAAQLPLRNAIKKAIGMV